MMSVVVVCDIDADRQMKFKFELCLVKKASGDKRLCCEYNSKQTKVIKMRK